MSVISQCRDKKPVQIINTPHQHTYIRPEIYSRSVALNLFDDEGESVDLFAFFFQKGSDSDQIDLPVKRTYP